ncbi:MAG TPA: nucleoside hydrolase [Candidatus Cybelea sp.]|nr:nucleoside hydrolase [Candidatus Cybelea sp.]
MAQRQKILIDCDPGHDDAVALLFAAHHMDLLAVTTVHGNAPLADTTRNALAVAELAKIDVPVAAGFAGPLVGKATHAASIHGRTGLDGADVPPPTRKPIEAHAVDVIVETARQHRGELVVATIGPETNLAVALRREPRLAGWLKEITVMGGSTARGNVTPAAEFNIYCDPEAAAIVFGCGAPIRMVGLNVTRETGFNAADIARLKSSGRRVATLIADLMAFYLERQRRAQGLLIAPMHDVCAIIPYVAPNLIEYADAAVAIECHGTYTRGMTVCDLRADAAQRNARVAVKSDARPLIDLVLDTILQYA